MTRKQKAMVTVWSLLMAAGIGSFYTQGTPVTVSPEAAFQQKQSALWAYWEFDRWMVGRLAVQRPPYPQIWFQSASSLHADPLNVRLLVPNGVAHASPNVTVCGDMYARATNKFEYRCIQQQERKQKT